VCRRQDSNLHANAAAAARGCSLCCEPANTFKFKSWRQLQQIQFAVAIELHNHDPAAQTLKPLLRAAGRIRTCSMPARPAGTRRVASLLQCIETNSNSIQFNLFKSSCQTNSNAQLHNCAACRRQNSNLQHGSTASGHTLPLQSTGMHCVETNSNSIQIIMLGDGKAPLASTTNERLS